MRTVDQCASRPYNVSNIVNLFNPQFNSAEALIEYPLPSTADLSTHGAATAPFAYKPVSVRVRQAQTASDQPLLGTVTLGGTGLGLAFEGLTILAITSVSDGDGLRSVAYEWTVGDEKIFTGAEYSFTPGDAHVGKQVSVTVICIDNNGNVGRISSTNSLPVVNVNDVPLGMVSIEQGPQSPGSILHAANTITDADGLGTLTYQWKADGQVISGATGADLTLTQAEAGKTITVVARYVDGHGHAEFVASDAAEPPSPRLNHPGSATIAGTVAAGQTVRAEVQDEDGTDTIYYQWQGSDTGETWTDLPGATARELTLGATAPVALRVGILYADGYGSVESHYVALGSDQADTLTGSSANESIFAAAGKDTIRYSSGIDRVDGGEGLDTFVSPFDRNFNIVDHSSTQAHEWSVSTFLGSITRLTDVERIRFSDISVALDTGGVAGQAYRLYQAAFNRAPDQFGIGFWISRLDLGVSLEVIADAFVNSAEFKTLYGSNPSNAEIVSKFYENVLHRAPEAGGYQFWVDVLDRHAVTLADVLVGFSDSDENVAALVGVTHNGIEYLPYT